MCSAVLAGYVASFDTAAQLCPSRSSSFVHMSARTVDRGDGRRRSARQQHGDLPQHAIDEHADRAVCPLPACDERPFSCSDPCATPTLKAFDPPQLLRDPSINDRMRLYAFTSSSTYPLLAPENKPTSAFPRTSKFRTAGVGSSKQQSSRATLVILLLAPQVLHQAPQPQSFLRSCCNLVRELLILSILMLTTLFLSVGTVASFDIPGCLLETASSRHQIRTLFIVFLALVPGGAAAGHVAQQKSNQNGEPAKTSTAIAMTPRNDPQTWDELTRATAAATSATIHLSVHFEMGEYKKEIHFGGKQLVIWGNNATLDAQKNGRFFSSTAGPQGKTSLELHDLVMQNGFASYVSFASHRVL